MSNKILLLFLVIILYRLNKIASSKNDIDELSLNLTALSKAYGYESEEYELTTQDGYILSLFRIYNKTALRNDAYPIVMLHGLLGCANNWILSARKSLPYLLADLGYDIWLINGRGTIYSHKHVKYTTDDLEYWKFSWHEIGIYDTPASIDFALNKTGHSKVFCIAHSEGTSIFFAMASDLPEYDNKVHMSIQMAPSIFLANIRNRLVYALSNYYLFFERLVDQIKLFTWVPNFDHVSKFLINLCQTDYFVTACGNMVKELFEDGRQVNTSMIPYIFSKVPCGGGIREALHYLQNAKSKGFNHYSYGPQKNLKIYGSTVPPPYNLGRIKSKVAIIYGPGDRFSTGEDSELLANSLQNVVFFKPSHNPNWTHMDFLVGKDVFDINYKDVIYLVQRYNKVDHK